ncbi:MAG: Nif3-like dinuclear metal center hexameric protein, partial [Clostridia bacterium]|nr:Nif3-like dinuclear metal center hexameric protein [Clostridia bacterium]
VGGAGGDFLENAKLLNCDAYVTGEVSYHTAQAAENMDLFLVCAGHFETEDVIVEPLTHMLNKKFPDLQFIPCHFSRIKYV